MNTNFYNLVPEFAEIAESYGLYSRFDVDAYVLKVVLAPFENSTPQITLSVDTLIDDIISTRIKKRTGMSFIPTIRGEISDNHQAIVNWFSKEIKTAADWLEENAEVEKD